MSIHTFTNYVCEDKKCILVLKTIVTTFCTTCHTTKDVGGCGRCELGCANDMMREYLLRSISYDEVMKTKAWKDLIRFLKKYDQNDPYARYICTRSMVDLSPKDKKRIARLRKYFNKKSFSKGMLPFWEENRLRDNIVKNLCDNASKEIDKYYKNLEKLRAKQNKKRKLKTFKW